MNKALKRYKGKKWRECGFKPANKASLKFSEWLYWQSESDIKKILGKEKARCFIKQKGKINLLINDEVCNA